MLLIIWVLSMFLQLTPPNVSMVVDTDAQTISVLSSDARITAIDLHINDKIVAVSVPLSKSQKVPFTVSCGQSDLIVYGVVADGEPDIIGARFSFFQTTITRPCYVYLPHI